MQNATSENHATGVYAPVPRGDTELDRLLGVYMGQTQWHMGQRQRQIEPATPRARTIYNEPTPGHAALPAHGTKEQTRSANPGVISDSSPRCLFLRQSAAPDQNATQNSRSPAGRRAPSRSRYPYPVVEASCLTSVFGSFENEIFLLQNDPHPEIVFPVSIWLL